MANEQGWTIGPHPTGRAPGTSYCVFDPDGALHATFAAGPDAERYARERNRAAGIGETGDAHAEVDEAMRSRITGRIAALTRLADYEETHLAVEEIGDEVVRDLMGLPADSDMTHEINSEELRDEAARQLAEETALEVTATMQFEIVLQTGGPDARLIVECDIDQDAPMAYPNRRYEIRRVLFRYSWTDSAEIELTGADREVAERFAREVVPELEGC